MNVKTVKISTAKGLKGYLDDVFQEGFKSALHQRALTEKEKQVALSKGDDHDNDSLFGSGGDDDKKSSKTMDDETEKLKKGDIEPKDIVDKLNSIRSGRSFHDSAVSSSMEEYIGSLSRAEKVALMAFLKGIAQIVTGEVPGQNASEPGEKPADVRMDKANEPNTVHKKPNVIKGGGGGGSKRGGGVENTSAPTPIVPKRR